VVSADVSKPGGSLALLPELSGFFSCNVYTTLEEGRGIYGLTAKLDGITLRMLSGFLLRGRCGSYYLATMLNFAPI